MKKLLVTFLVFLLLIPFVFGKGQEEKKAPKKITLTFLEVMTSPSRTKVLKSVIAQYEKLHPGVTINLISPPYEQADNKLTLMLNAKQPLDIIEVRDYTVKQFVNNGYLLNLESRLKTWKYAKSLLPITWSSARVVNNTAYFIPEFFYIKGLFVRTDITKKLGVTSKPKTFKELYRICKKITDPAKNQYGYDFRGKGNSFAISDILIFSDVPNINPNNMYETLDGKSVFRNPIALKSFKAYIDLYRKAVPPDGINWGFNEQINSFVSGITPYLVQDPDTIALVDKQLGRDHYTVVEMPVGASGKAYLGSGYAGLGIVSYSKHKDAAWDFVAYFSSPKVNADFNKKYGPLPIHSTTFKNDPYFRTGVYQAFSKEMADTKRYEFVKLPLGSKKFPGWPQVQEQYMQAALLGKITPEKAMEKWAEYWEN